MSLRKVLGASLALVLVFTFTLSNAQSASAASNNMFRDAIECAKKINDKDYGECRTKEIKNCYSNFYPAGRLARQYCQNQFTKQKNNRVMSGMYVLADYCAQSNNDKSFQECKTEEINACTRRLDKGFSYKERKQTCKEEFKEQSGYIKLESTVDFDGYLFY